MSNHCEHDISNKRFEFSRIPHNHDIWEKHFYGFTWLFPSHAPLASLSSHCMFLGEAPLYRPSGISARHLHAPQSPPHLPQAA